MIRIVDRAMVAHPYVQPTLFVDDLGAEVCGSPHWLLRQLGGFFLAVCRGVTAAGMEISAKKSVCLASTRGLGEQLQRELSEFGVKFVLKAKALGSGLGAGVKRNVLVLTQRLKQFKTRKSRYRLLKRAGVDTPNLLRTGGLSAETYGSEVMGVAPTMLLNQRRTAAVMAAPASGVG